MKPKIVPTNELPKCRYCGKPMYECINRLTAFYKCKACGAQSSVVYRDVHMEMSDPEKSYMDTDQSMLMRALEIAKKTDGLFDWHEFTTADELPEGEDILVAGKDGLGNVEYIVVFKTADGEVIIPGTSFTLRNDIYDSMKYALICDPFMDGKTN